MYKDLCSRGAESIHKNIERSFDSDDKCGSQTRQKDQRDDSEQSKDGGPIDSKSLSAATSRSTTHTHTYTYLHIYICARHRVERIVKCGSALGQT